MRASLISCIRNGGLQLDLFLKHIADLAGPADLEIILVDNDSNDGTTLDKLRRLQDYCSFKVIVAQCSTPGNSAGRNTALGMATGDLMLFIDGDCYVDKNFALDWLDIFESHGFGYASGRILRFDLQYSDIGCNEREDREVIPKKKFVRRGFIQGSNMAFTKACLEAAGPFDIRFGAGTPFAGEEWEVALKASFLGFSGGYFPDPTVLHDHRRLTPAAQERLLFYDHGAGAVYAKHLIRRYCVGMARQFFGEVKSMRSDPKRLSSFLRGFFNYYLQALKQQI